MFSKKVVVVWLCVSQVCANMTSTLHLMHLSCTVINGYHLPSIVDLAVDMVNNNTDILPNYKLQVHHSHATQVSVL